MLPINWDLRFRCVKRRALPLVVMWAFISSAGAIPAGATCLDLNDIPMDTQLQAAPANIMFVIDDSGSMDWEFMTPQNEGIFEGEYYNFAMSDNAYDNSTYVIAGEEKRLWKARWAGYNRMYYNPAVDYLPWPNMPDASPTAPRSNPINSTPTLTLANEFDSVETGVIVDNTDAGFTKSSNGWGESSYSGDYGSNYYYTSGNNYGTAWARWTVDIPAPGTYEVFAWWVATSDRVSNATYRIFHNGVENTVSVNQRINGSTWNSLGSFYFSGGGNEYIQLNATTSGTSKYCADAIKVSSAGSSTISIKNSHYYSFSASENTPYLLVLDGTIKYYRFTSNVDNLSLAGLTLNTSPPDDVVPKNEDGTPRTYAQELQNFANWFSYYRRREFTAKAAIARVIDGIQGVNVGFYSIWGRLNQVVLPVNVTKDGITYDNTDTLLTLLYGLYSSGGTPLRAGLRNVGYYFANGGTSDGTSGIGSSPYASDEDGGACQQCFAIVMTDGYWNGSVSGIGNEDGNQGAPYADNWYPTLADVAMRFYKNDLSPALSNLVPTNYPDMANWQHMVTYGVSFGVNGTLNPDNYDLYNVNPASRVYPVWPNPMNTEDQERIDDLWHATVNGRGEFLSASNPQELIDSLQALMENIMARIGSGASISVNGEELHAGTRLYLASYATDGWTGDVKAYAINQTTGVVMRDSPIWSASSVLDTLDWDTGRIIAAYNITSGGGVPFRYASLSPAMQAMLSADPTTAQHLLNYIRGDASNEQSNGGGFRDRNDRLGDIVHSSPIYFKDVIYAGANDGMLHAFDASTGSEIFAYVPGLVFPNLAQLSAPAYAHRFFVDLTPYAADIGNTDLLVGGLGKGGKGYYCLDITNASGFTSEAILAGKVKWEFPANGATDPDMGYSYSEAYIVRSNTGGWIVIFGNGYASANEKAVLFILDATTGSVLKRIDTGVGSCNGLSSPVPVDVDTDNKVDYVYAGDLKGNLWKFDLTDASAANWDVAYKSGSTPQPLFQAKDASGNAQPITTRPDVMGHCVSCMPGHIVVFGTGKYLGNSDFEDSHIQTVYGVWDYGDDDDNTEYLGAFNRPNLSNQSQKVSLLEQFVIPYDQTYRLVSENPITWVTQDDGDQGVNPSSTEDNHAGWYLDLPITKERVIRNLAIRDGRVILISSVPKDSPCAAGGDSILQEINACTGGGGIVLVDANSDGVIDANDLTDTNSDGLIDSSDWAGLIDKSNWVEYPDPDNPSGMALIPPGMKPLFDINYDGIIDMNDMLVIPNPDDPSTPLLISPTGITYPEMIYPPKILRNPDGTETKYSSTAAGNIQMLREQGEKRGVVFWRSIE